ncbi:polysaccharide export protein [Allorhizobium sp. BGMRC 0089]|uniref:polysaccharide biosynthesis/export family protein n=1 Tax=Allorhizobium sonneratiae TaxID=2934936 RepID=UPI002033799D|nr:polysaccharide biosynthesis/export family protein [Allorhizobium sonneratiae]MCM2293285.1 polysaccharide export protein [Allorhizobium sonneratiae]
MAGSFVAHALMRWGKVPQAGWLARLAMVVPLFAGLWFPCAAFAQDYLVGPQDKLKISVVEWRPVTATAYEWQPLTGQFMVSAAGNLSLPIIGIVPVSGKTVEKIAAEISERLQKQVGLQKSPSTSVEVAEYRPFYVVGLAARPGKYPFVPGMSVIEALSIAGGVAGPVNGDLLAIQRQVLTERGELRSLDVERLSLLAREARLKAVVDRADKVTFPKELLDKAKRADIASILQNEESLFKSTKSNMDSEIQTLKKAKTFASSQIQVLKSKEATLKNQSDMADKELGSVNKLIAQGVASANRQYGAAQYVSELHSRSLDVSMALISVQQSMEKSDWEMNTVQDKYRVEALGQLSQVRDQLAANLQKSETARALLANLEAHAPQIAATAENDMERPLITTILRTVDGEMRKIAATEATPIQPGDVIQIEREKSDPAQSGMTIAPAGDKDAAADTAQPAVKRF